jgi:hypothetical protein
MATYKGLRGLTIRTVAGDASPLIAGDIWYNSSSRKIRGAKLPVGAWASSTAVNTGRRSMAATGQNTEAVLIAGGIGGNQLNEVWNGSSWTEAGDLNTAKHYHGGFGTTTSAIMVGGIQAGLPDPNHVAVAESWDNSSWTEVADLNTTRAQHAGAGVSNTSGTVFGGGGWTSSPMDTVFAIQEEWNGTAWSEEADLNTARFGTSGTGTVTAALCASGSPPPSPSTTVESWNGTAWTEQPDVNSGRTSGGLAGTTTSAIFYGGYGGLQLTEQYDGSSWTEAADLPANKAGMGSVGASAQSAFSASGYNNSANVTASEEWSQVLAAVTFTSS